MIPQTDKLAPGHRVGTLESLLTRVREARELDARLFWDICEAVIPSLSLEDSYHYLELAEVEAWTELALSLVERVLPEWMIEMGDEVYGDSGEIAEPGGKFCELVSPQRHMVYRSHSSLPLAILTALLTALLETLEVQEAG